MCTQTTAAGSWTPESVRHGIGGSEEAVINVAAQLAARGHRVSVHLPGAPGRTFAGVEYSGYDRLRRASLDVLVIWRRPALLDESERRGAIARRSYLWLHDIGRQEALLSCHARFHKIIILSLYHGTRYPDLPAERFMVTPNGIDLDHFRPPDPRRDPLLVVYGSDYVRGLRAVLNRWPAIRKAVPQARLHVFYGWQGIDRYGASQAERLKRELRPLLKQAGIVHLARISHAAVAAQYRRAGIWAYPCSYHETSCISAMKAQAGGAVPVVIPTGALEDTVRFGFRTRYNYDDVPSALSEAELLDEWQEGLVGMLRSPERQDQIRDDMVAASRARFDWAHVITAWEREFLSIDLEAHGNLSTADATEPQTRPRPSRP